MRRGACSVLKFNDEVISDTYKFIEVRGGALWEVNCKQAVPQGQDKTEFQFSSRVPTTSAEGDYEDGGEEGESKMVFGIISSSAHLLA
ncbi:hypothetical protein KEM54_000483 [Ascosphaera aggregata]|nr:hypothetical protein KEM54_000483 [Ascosphaera aggregata]